MGKGSGISDFDTNQLQNIFANPIVEGATRNSLNAAEELLGLPSSADFEAEYRNAGGANPPSFTGTGYSGNPYDAGGPYQDWDPASGAPPTDYGSGDPASGGPAIATRTSGLRAMDSPDGGMSIGRAGRTEAGDFFRNPPQQNTLPGVPNTPEFYPLSTVAGMDPRRGAALQGLFERGMGGSPEEQQLSDFLSSQLGGGGATGGLLSGLGVGQDALGQAASGQINPLVGEAFRSAAGDLTEAFNEQVVPGINATFASAGRSGSGLQADALGNAAGELSDTLGSMAADMYGGAAESALERQLAAGGLLQQGGLGGLNQQLAAAGLVPESAALDYAGLDAALGAGQGFEDYAQRLIDAGRERYEYNASRPLQDYQRNLDALGQYIGLTGPLQGTGTTTSSGSGSESRFNK
jgi:hypothetical protein